MIDEMPVDDFTLIVESNPLIFSDICLVRPEKKIKIMFFQENSLTFQALP